MKEKSNKKERRRISAKGLVMALLALILSAIVAFILLSLVHKHRMDWTAADSDNDGIILLHDTDPDGDGISFCKDRDANNNGKANEAEALSYAGSMTGVPYDPLMGKFDNVLGKLGMVVCIDVPVRAYLSAGVSFPALLRQSAAEHPDWFHINTSNHKEDPFFYRRVRNYFNLFKNHPCLEVSSSPRPGDLAFYGKTHIAVVTSVTDEEKFKVIEASPYRLRVVKSTSSYMADTYGPPSFFGRIDYEQ